MPWYGDDDGYHEEIIFRKFINFSNVFLLGDRGNQSFNGRGVCTIEIASMEQTW
jgi:hypothetical protein